MSTYSSESPLCSNVTKLLFILMHTVHGAETDDLFYAISLNQT